MGAPCVDPTPCVCPEHLRALLETRDALRRCSQEVQRQTAMLEKAMRRPQVPQVRTARSARPGPSPMVTVAAEILKDTVSNPVIKRTLLEILHGGEPPRRRRT